MKDILRFCFKEVEPQEPRIGIYKTHIITFKII